MTDTANSGVSEMTSVEEMASLMTELVGSGRAHECAQKWHDSVCEAYSRGLNEGISMTMESVMASVNDALGEAEGIATEGLQSAPAGTTIN